MCVNTHYVYNRYIRKSILVDCGKCPSCQQKKAASRASRIRNNISDGNICLFVTLTYKNEFVPYIRSVDVKNQLNALTVYRDSSVRRVRLDGDYKIGFRSIDSVHELDTFWVRDLWNKTIDFAPELNKKPHCVGVCYYKDLQDFFKRLRQNLKRHYNYEGKFTSFSCSEYGGSSYRPHFHSLIFLPKSCENIFRSAIVESWPFADQCRTAKFIEVARDCASYVSSYVNSGNCLFSVLSFSPFRQKHSYSKTFGLGVDCFNLPSLLEKIKSGDLRYYSKVFRDGKSTIAGFPIPKYVINRYFPLFKGFSRLSPSSLRDVILRPENIANYENRLNLDISCDDFCRIKTRIDNAYYYYHKVSDRSRFDFAWDYSDIWKIRKSVILKDSLVNDIYSVTDWLSHYENINDLNADLVIAPTLTSLFDKSCFEEQASFPAGS